MIRVAFVIGGYPPEEHKRRADVALSYSTQEVQVGIVDVAASPYFYGMTPAEIQWVAPAFIESFKRAEKEGYDAVVPLGTLELGVDGVNPLSIFRSSGPRKPLCTSHPWWATGSD